MDRKTGEKEEMNREKEYKKYQDEKDRIEKTRALAEKKFITRLKELDADVKNNSISAMNAKWIKEILLNVHSLFKISLYDALLFAKTSFCFRWFFYIFLWIFSSDTGLYNSTLDTVHINTIGYLIGDVDNRWKFI